MNERALTATVHQAIAAAAADQPGLAVGSIQATRGWGDILFVRVQVRLRGGPSAEVQAAMEHRFQTAVREALDGERSTVSVTWTSD